MKLTRPLVFLDIESATAKPNHPDPQLDRIIEISACKFSPHPSGWDPDPMELAFRCNPGIPINKECSDIHGYTDERVKDWPPFKKVAPGLLEFIGTSDIGGFGVWGYDIPLLAAECDRNGLSFCWRSRLVIDAGMVFRKFEERTLTAAAMFYCNLPHEGAHGAIADTRMAVRVFKAQLERYPELGAMAMPELHKFCQYDDAERLTLDGAIVKGPDGDPVYTHKKVKGVKVKDDLGYARWMLYKADFPRDTREWLEAYITSLEEPKHDQDDMFLR